MNKEIKTTRQSENEDFSLIESFNEGNIEAFNMLVIKHKDMTFNLCYQVLGDYDEASDSAQETFIKVYNNLKKFKFKSSFTTWLYRIAVNTCRNRLTSSAYRKAKKMVRINGNAHGEENSEPMAINDTSYSPEKIFENGETHQAIREAVNSLPDNLRILVVLRDLEGKSYEAISDITGMKLGTIKSRLARARHQLRGLLEEVVR